MCIATIPAQINTSSITQLFIKREFKKIGMENYENEYFLIFLRRRRGGDDKCGRVTRVSKYDKTIFFQSYMRLGVGFFFGKF